MSEQLERPTIDTAETLRSARSFYSARRSPRMRPIWLCISPHRYSVYHMTVVGDNPGRMKDAILQAVNRADLVILGRIRADGR